MNKSDLIERVHTKNKFLLIKDVDDSVNNLIDFLVSSLSDKHRIEIRGFGSFSTRKRTERIARNPRTGKAISVQTKYHPYFRASKSLKNLLKI